MTPRSSLAALGALLLLLLTPARPGIAADAGQVSVRDLLSAPDRWHGLPVILTGTVAHLERRVSGRGNAYFKFRLVDHGVAVTVFSYGVAEVAEGARVRVEGTFLKVNRVGQHTFQNEVTATRIRPF